MKLNKEITLGNVLASILIIGSVTMTYAKTQSDITLLEEKIKTLPTIVDKLESVLLEVTRHDERLKQCQLQYPQ